LGEKVSAQQSRHTQGYQHPHRKPQEYVEAIRLAQDANEEQIAY
jgi:hypothetical protein